MTQVLRNRQKKSNQVTRHHVIADSFCISSSRESSMLVGPLTRLQLTSQTHSWLLKTLRLLARTAGASNSWKRPSAGDLRLREVSPGHRGRPRSAHISQGHNGTAATLTGLVTRARPIQSPTLRRPVEYPTTATRPVQGGFLRRHTLGRSQFPPDQVTAAATRRP